MMLQDYIGIPWQREANCWDLIRLYYKQELGITLPEHPIAARRNALEGASGWTELQKPVHECLAGMQQGTVMHHAGIYLDVDGGGILHGSKPQSSFLRLTEAERLGYTNIRYFLYTP